MTGKSKQQTSANWPIRRMSHIVDQHLLNITRALQPCDLTAPIWRVLNGLHEGGDATVGDLARHTAFERSYVSRLVSRMAELGLVKASGDSRDRRYRHVTLTEEGRAKREAAVALVQHLNESSLKGLSENEKKTLFRLLNIMADNIGAYRPE